MCHVQRRIHGHPIFPILVALGGRVEVRASWAGYLVEFRQAYATASRHLGDIRALQRRLLAGAGAAGDGSGRGDAGVAAAVDRGAASTDDIGAIEELTVSEPLSNFEAKYVGVQLPLHRLVIINDGGN